MTGRPEGSTTRAGRPHGPGTGGRQLGTAAIWGWPVVLGLLTTIGLISALFSDGGFGDMLAGVCLTVPVLACIWYGWLRRRPG